jgi:hypothetical protein
MEKVWRAPLDAKVEFDPKTVHAIIEGQPVRRQTLATFKRTVDGWDLK